MTAKEDIEREKEEFGSGPNYLRVAELCDIEWLDGVSAEEICDQLFPVELDEEGGIGWELRVLAHNVQSRPDHRERLIVRLRERGRA